MINIYRAIRHNDYKTAWRLIWKIKSRESDWWYDVKKVPEKDRTYRKKPEDEVSMDFYYVDKERLLSFLLKNRKRMKRNRKEDRLFEVPESD